MKRTRSAVAVSIILALMISHPSSAIAAAKKAVVVKKAGRSTTLVPNTILSGNGVPTKAFGIDGDFYIDIKDANLYGPKTKGVWKLATSLRMTESKSISTATSGATGERSRASDC